MCIVTPPPTQDKPDPADSPAKLLTPQQRRQLALDALAGQPVTRLAQQHNVSRKFVRQQRDLACAALDQAFAPQPPQREKVLFYLPVTRSWLRQFVIVLVLVGRCSLRSVCEILADLFDYRMSLGTAHNILHSAVPGARSFNEWEDLSAVKTGLHDEIHQAGLPVLVGVDARSTYCYLLSLEAHRDADTWGVRLLELAQRGFAPAQTIADFAKGLRSGQEQAMPAVPCWGDIFHGLYEFGPVVRHLERRAYEAMAATEKLGQQQKRHEWRNGRKDREVSGKLPYACKAEQQAIALADDVATLLSWLQQDILAVAGPDHPTRRELLDFVLAELIQREEQCEQRIRPIRVLLENQGDLLLAFAEQLDKDLAALAQRWEVSTATVRDILQIQEMSERVPQRWQREAMQRQHLGTRYYGLYEAVKELAAGVVRASSLVENVNSRLRTYFFLRRQLSPEYLELLRFFLNHRRLPRSERDERVGKSPAELLSGYEHAHWLQLLGYQRFRRAA
jgi:hypothetical protein